MTNTISFPGLFGISFTINREAFALGPLSVKWYGIILCLGFVLATLYASKRATQFGATKDTVSDYLLWLIPSTIIGARLYYVLFRLDYYLDNPEKIIRIWEGGIAIYGGILAGIICTIVFAKVKKIDFFNFGDLIVLGLLIGQFVGRWGNFVNAEAFGTQTALIWGMSINGASPVHPTFLYESLWNFAGFLFLHFYSKHRKFKGEIILLCFGWYGAGRAWVEGLRTDSLYIGSTDIRVSQFLGAVFFVISLCLLLFLYIGKRYKKIPFLSIEKTAS